MRYTLKDYQEDAVGDVLRHLTRARRDWHRWESPVAFSLSATTGAGKTVMAAAVIEALFHGKPAYGFHSDPGAVVLWFTDDPSLNEQTRFRLLDAADRIAHSRLVVIENTFNQAKLDPGKVYFLNRQKLGKKSLLVRGTPVDSPVRGQRSLLPTPDARAYTMWDTVANTIANKHLTLYLILDEAHRGMKPPNQRDRAEKATIVQRLINGANGVPPVPIVWGISATVQRFNEAMARAEGRTTYPPVAVDPVRIQESGLLKDDIRLEFPTEAGQFNTVLLARATQKVKESTDRWRAYSEREGVSADTVVPLLVVQVPNTPSDELLLSAFTTIQETWPELDEHVMAHVFGDHAPIKVGGFSVPHVRPETVQDRTNIRVLFAKDAISTGWDCPRAEVLVSFRPAQDETHITQLLGRMVRTPLARRVPGDDVLNSVSCLLPHFDLSAATRVAKAMMGDRSHDADGTGGGAGRRVLLAPVDMDINQAIPEAVWKTFDDAPSQTLPRKTARPVRRLAALGQALSRDGLRADARKHAYRSLFAKLDGLLVQHKEEVATASKGILEVKGETLVARVVGGKIIEHRPFVAVADEQSVEADFRTACRVLTADLARKYADHVAGGDEDDDGLFDAHVKVSALAQVDGISDELDREANKIAKRWFAKYRVAIKGLTDERRAVYDEIKGMSPEPQATEVKRPRIRTEETEDADGNELETRTRHLMSDGNGNFPVGLLNQWEIEVLDKEMGRSDFQAWYRNPSRPSGDALTVAYKDARGRWRRMCPDFLFFHGDSENMMASIVDPHGHHLADALPKLRGLAEFAAMHGESFHRIESVARMNDGALRVLDLTDPDIRRAIARAVDTQALFRGDEATDY
ncbi:MAG: DEAD/DEAH box helicase family protein [Bryobacterales bacterium]|nr:DEAD/DEAH box helicase family protein [Bryobacterales bacterium]MDE0629378.1 DEAD/DEAH box helicase family protein [Bryobacterales bacterium]